MKTVSFELKNQIQIGKDLARAKDYKRAEKIFVQILKEQSLADVHNALGLCYADTGNFKAAEFCFLEALKINPNYMEAALNLSVLYNNLGFGKKSTDIYKKLKSYGSKGRGAMDPMLMSRIANLFAEIGDLFNGVGEYKYAIEAYESAVDLKPEYIDIQTKLAVALREDGQKKKAIQIFEKQKNKAKNYAPFWTALGVTYYAENNALKAKEAWLKALKIDPQNRTIKSYLQLNLSGKRPAQKKTAPKKKKKSAKKK